MAFATAGDGQLFSGVTSDQQWARFVEEFGLQRLAADPRLATNVMRLQERSWLIPALQEVLGALPQEEVARRCERANVSWAPVGQQGDLFTDPHLLATGGLVDVFISRAGGEEGKKVGPPAMPVEFGESRRRPGVERQPPGWASTIRRCWPKRGLQQPIFAALAEAGVITGASG